MADEFNIVPYRVRSAGTDVPPEEVQQGLNSLAFQTTIALNSLAGGGGTIPAGNVTYNEGGTGAITRTLTSKLQDYVSVKDFGATGNGTTDDTAAIQAAGNASPRIYFPPGIYLYSTLTFSGGVQLAGAGKYNSILKTSSLTGNTLVFGTQGWKILDLGFDATANRTSGAHVSTNARYGEITSVSFTKFYIGIDLDGATGVEISDLNALDGTPASVSAGGAILRLGNTTVTGGINIRGVIADVNNPALQPSNGIICKYVDVVTISGALIIHHTNVFSVVPSGGQTASLIGVVNSTFDTAASGAVLAPTSGGTITRVNFTNTWFGEHSADGLVLNGASGAITEVAAINCMFHANGGSGANVTGANVNGVFFSNSFAAANAANGLTVASGAVNVNWSGGTLGAVAGLVGNTGFGVSVDAAAVSGNVINTNLEGNTGGRINNPGNLFVAFGNTPYTLTNGATTFPANFGPVTVNGSLTVNNTTGDAIVVNGTGSSGGAQILLEGNGATTPNKLLAAISGNLSVFNSAVSQVILTLTDAGVLSAPGGLNSTPVGNTTPSSGAFTTLSSTGNFTPSQTNGIVGTTTNNNANAGSVGEFPTPTNLSAVALTLNTPANVSSVSLTAGDWDVTGVVSFTPAAGTSMNAVVSGPSTTSATIGGPGTFAAISGTLGTALGQSLPAPVVRMSLAATTTVFLVAQATFSGGTCTASGFLRARRIR